MKQQGKNLRHKINKEEKDNLTGKEFREMVVKVI